MSTHNSSLNPLSSAPGQVAQLIIQPLPTITKDKETLIFEIYQADIQHGFRVLQAWRSAASKGTVKP